MLILIRKVLNTFFLIVILLLSAPTLLFLTKWYYGNLITTKTYIGVLDIPQTIEKSEEIINAAKTLFTSADIRGIIINCDGNGGNAGACQAIHSDLMKLKKIYKKPIIAYIERNSIAGSYLIASASDFIVATNAATIGYFNLFATNQKINSDMPIHLETIKNAYSIQYKKILQSSRPQINKEIINQSCDLFYNSLSTAEHMQSIGFVDFIGGNLEVERIMRSKTVIEGCIEKVHGSFLEHFIFYTSDLIKRTIQGFSTK